MLIGIIEDEKMRAAWIYGGVIICILPKREFIHVG